MPSPGAASVLGRRAYGEAGSQLPPGPGLWLLSLLGSPGAGERAGHLPFISLRLLKPLPGSLPGLALLLASPTLSLPRSVHHRVPLQRLGAPRC